jgi:hypothetical protein
MTVGFLKFRRAFNHDHVSRAPTSIAGPAAGMLFLFEYPESSPGSDWVLLKVDLLGLPRQVWPLALAG